MIPTSPKGYLVILILLVLVSAGILQATGTDTPESAMKEIKTAEELQKYLENTTAQYRYTGYSNGELGDVVFAQDVAETPLLAAAPATGQEKTSSLSSTGGAASYSATNIQVAGVDEADFVKNDGRYIYLESGGTLTIVQAYPPEQGKIVAEIPVKGSVSELFLSGDRLVVFSDSNDESWYTPEGSHVPVPDYHKNCHATIYDISDRGNTKEIRDISAPGRYEDARMIGNYVYFISEDTPDYAHPRMPVIYDGTEAVDSIDVWCPPYPMNEYLLHTITSFPVNGTGRPEAESFLLGYGNTLYVSPENVYVAYEKHKPVVYLYSPENNARTPDENDQESVIHRFAIKDGTITYKATGTVPGYLLNQFSLDEYQGNLRMATTVSNWLSGEKQYSNVYVLDPSMKIIGRLEHLSPDEKIYSARFMQDLLYLVTFKQTDPLFVIDLSNPNQPGLLGELKIPGYSDYLHPYDDTHLIGIGKDTMENEQGGVVPTGVKIALFDVHDLNNPRLVDSRVIGEKGSDSAILSDHRAFLLNKEQNIMAIPIREVTHVPVSGSSHEGSYTEESWQGTYVFGIDPNTGFIEKGRIKQEPGGNDEDSSYGSSVLRSITMDEVLYTISRDRIVGSSIWDLTKRLLDIPVKHEEQIWYE